MTLDQIKAEMRELCKVKNGDDEIDHAYELAVEHYENRLANLEDPDAKLWRVRDKVRNDMGMSVTSRLKTLEIIDAELTEKEQKNVKQKIEIEVDVPEGMELVNIDDCRSTNIGGDAIGFSGFGFLRPIGPPLELETDLFVKRGEIDSDEITTQIAKEDGLCIDTGQVSSPAEARDLAKILNYWAETGKLPERVVVKGGAK